MPPITPIKLPTDLVKPPERYVSDLQPGEQGWINWTDLEVDDDLSCYVSEKAKLIPVTKGAALWFLQVTRQAGGLVVTIQNLPGEIKLSWKPHTLSDKSNLVPVVVLERPNL